MAEPVKPAPGSEDWWRVVLTDPKAHFEPLRRFFIHLPSSPHCKLCGAPFKGPGGLVLGALGFSPWEKNPSLCNACIRDMKRRPANAEFSGETLERRELTLRGRTATIAIRSGTVDSLGPVVT